MLCDIKTQWRSLAGVTSCFHEVINFPVNENYMVHNLENPALRPTQSTTKWMPLLYPVVKQKGRGADHLSSSSAEVHERVQLYLFSPCEPSLFILGLNLP